MQTLLETAELPETLSVSVEPKNPTALRVVRSLGRTVSSFPVLIAAGIAGITYRICRSGIADPDIWWHLRNAKYFFAHWRFPAVDAYSFTAVGSAWLNHEWLSELVYYGAFGAAGLRGVFAVFAALLAALLVCVFALAMRESKDPLVAGITSVAGGVLATVGFGPRTQHLGWLCFVAIYAILLRFRSVKRAPLWLIPILFCLWINCHGSWLIGLIIYGIFACMGMIRRDIGGLVSAPWTASQMKRLVLTGIVSIAALFINPFGYRLVAYPFDMIFRQTLNIASVQEWASVDFNDTRGKFVALVLGAVFAMAIIGRKRWRIDDAVLTAFVLYCGLTHARFLLLTGIVLPPLLAPRLGRLSSYDPNRERRVFNTALLTAVAGACVLAFPSARALDKQVVDYFPVRAADFLRAHPQQGHMFNVYQWGGYLEWALPGTPTFIDSRTDIFEYKGVLKDYLDALTLKNSQEILDRYHVAYVVYSEDTALSYFLSKSTGWERIYQDGQTVIYRRVQRPRASQL